MPIEKKDVKVVEKAKETLAKTGSISSGDLASFAAPEPEVVDNQKDLMTETTEVDSGSSKDPVIGAGKKENIFDISKSGPAKKIQVTPEDKKTFIDSLIKNKRMYSTFTRLNGEITIKIRSRKQEETRAIVSRLKYETENGLIETNYDHTTRLRQMLMAAQVESLNDTDFAEMAKPYKQVKNSEGKMDPPGWITQADEWASFNEALSEIIWTSIRDFEDKYWTMTAEAANQNFWQPATST